MNRYKPNKITREKFLKLNEDDLMFITNPGRMGDENGATFIIKNGEELTIYRIDGWMYPSDKEKEEYNITYEDMLNHFPKWHEVLKHFNEKDYHGKYKYVYMGFGNGLSVDNFIYDEFEPYLNNLVEKYLKKYSEDERKNYIYAAIFNVWENALMEMTKDKKLIIK